MRAIDGFNHTFAAEGSSAAASLVGGQYELSAASGNWNGAVLTVDRLLPDGATWLADGMLVLTHANGVVTNYLPPGQYRLTVSSANPTDPVYAAVSRVPDE